MTSPVRVGAAAWMTVAVVALSACSFDTDPLARKGLSSGASSGASKTISGAGASSQENAMNVWRAAFQQRHPGIQVTYDGVGSGAGVEQFLTGQVAFAGSDKALSEEEIIRSVGVCQGRQAINLPVYVSPIAVVFNLEGIEHLNMAPSTVAKIFNDQITRWDDPEIARHNPGVSLPDLAITSVHRADKSGTTENFTAYLASAAPGEWPYESSKEWPVASGESGDKTAGLIQAVQAGQGTIGYADASQVGSLGSVSLQVGEAFVAYSPENAGKGVAGARRTPGRAEHDLALELDYAEPVPGAYPLVLVSYLIACPGHPSAEQAAVVSDFLAFVASDEAQKNAQESAGAAPLPADFAQLVQRAARSIAH